MRTYEGDIFELKLNQIFVFGSNTQGRHGKGAALMAKERFGAKYGQAEGLQGQSYAIITKDLTKEKHPSRTIEQIQEQINKLYVFALSNPNKEFIIAYKASGANLNAYSSKDMASMFSSMRIPENIIFEKNFSELLTKSKTKTKMEVTGILKRKTDAQQVSEKFKKREFVLTENSSQYPQHISFQLTQDKCGLIDNIAEGAELKVHFNLRGREWVNPKGEAQYFNTLEAWKIETTGAVAAPKAETSKTNVAAASGPSTFVASTGADDDLPF